MLPCQWARISLILAVIFILFTVQANLWVEWLLRWGPSICYCMNDSPPQAQRALILLYLLYIHFIVEAPFSDR